MPGSTLPKIYDLGCLECALDALEAKPETNREGLFRLLASQIGKEWEETVRKAWEDVCR